MKRFIKLLCDKRLQFKTYLEELIVWKKNNGTIILDIFALVLHRRKLARKNSRDIQ